MAKTYNLRPPAGSISGLETLFRVEMKRDDMNAENVKPGDPVLITSQNGKGGVGIAFLSSDTTKSSSPNSFVKVSPELRDFLGLDLTEKCEIKKYKGSLRKLKKIWVGEKGNNVIGEELGQDEMVYWASSSLGK